MSTGAAQTWFVAGTIPFMLAGGVHALATLLDAVRPTFFSPIERSVLPALEGTGIRFRELFPGGSGATPSMWRAWLGFNISHGLGLFTFGLLCLIIGIYDFALVEDVDPIRPLTIAVSAAYLVLSLRFWFYVPTITIGVGTACFAVASALSL
ncbi:MAG: LIC_13387 family protein [Thermoleophilaceae bacterium]